MMDLILTTHSELKTISEVIGESVTSNKWHAARLEWDGTQACSELSARPGGASGFSFRRQNKLKI